MNKRAAISILATLFLLGVIIQPVMGQEKPKLPKVISITALGVGGFSHMMASGIAEGILAGTGMQCRVEGQPTSVARLLPLRSGEAELTFVPLFVSSEAALGWGNFGRKEWGPQPIRVVYLGPNTFNGQPYVRGNSGVSTIADLKGKRLARVPGMTVTDSIQFGVLAFANLTKDDVKWVTVPGIIKIYDAVLEGTVDVGSANPGSPGAYKQASSPAGIRWLQLPHDDKEGWARLFKHAPFMFPMYGEQGAGISKEKPLWGIGSPLAIHSYAHLSEDVAYAVTKAIDEKYETLKSIHQQFAGWTLDACLDSAIAQKMILPYHEGSIKYFKEKGRWTPDFEAANQKALDLEKQRMAEWNAKK